MAEAPAEKSLEILSQELTCSLCCGHYASPRLLGCCHYFCENCLRDLVEEKPNRVGCPECGSVTELPPAGDVSSLPRVSFVDRLKELHTRMAMIRREKEAVCESCSALEAGFFCHQCADFMCNECAASHAKTSSKYAGHRVASLNQLQENGARTIPLKPPTSSRCACGRPDALREMYCRDCRRLACESCMRTEHCGHRRDLAKKCASQSRRSLQQSLFPLRIIAQQLTETLGRIGNTKRDIASQGEHVEQSIRSYFDEIISLLEKEKQRLLTQSADFVQAKLKSLSAQEQTITRASSEVQNVLEYCKQTTDLVSDEELLLVQKRLQNRVKEECSKHQSRSVEDPCESANIAVQTTGAEDLIQSCRERAKVYLFPTGNNSRVHVAEVGKETTQCVMDASDPLFTPGLSSFSAWLVSVVDGSTSEARVTPVGKGLYEVTYTPRVRGRHQLWVERDGRRISDTPLPVFATISPSLLGKPVHSMEGLKHPYSAVFDSQNQLFVTQSGGNRIQRFTRRGSEIVSESFATSRRQNCPTGMAIDSDGFVYVVNMSTHSLSKFDSSGELVGEVGREGGDPDEMNHPSGVAIVGERVYVCDRKNDRVKVYTKELKLVEMFGSHGRGDGEMNWPYDIACGGGDSDTVYVADSDNHRVQVFDRSGRFLRSFGGSGGERGSLMRPTGVCIGRDGLLYVTEYANHRVSVFHSDGRYVGSFGSYGSDPGQLCYPVGVTVDDDGFLYVCDQGNNRIQVF